MSKNSKNVTVSFQLVYNPTCFGCLLIFTCNVVIRVELSVRSAAVAAGRTTLAQLAQLCTRARRARTWQAVHAAANVNIVLLVVFAPFSNQFHIKMSSLAMKSHIHHLVWLTIPPSDLKRWGDRWKHRWEYAQLIIYQQSNRKVCFVLNTFACMHIMFVFINRTMERNKIKADRNLKPKRTSTKNHLPKSSGANQHSRHAGSRITRTNFNPSNVAHNIATVNQSYEVT